jgi:uncharacterized protein DUF6893
MLDWGNTGTVRTSITVSPARSQEIYQSYAVALYRQALLNLDDPAPAGNVVGDVLINECALAAKTERGEDGARYRLAESGFRRSRLLRDERHQRRGPLSRTRREQKEIMRAPGYATAITMAVAGTALGVLAVKALPDMRRYVAMRKI